MVIAHHKAHQRGYAKEDEANFIGYVICINSTEPYVRYSGYLYGLKVLEVLSKGNVDRYNDLLSRVNDGPRTVPRRARSSGRDKESDAERHFAPRFSAYLRVNRVHGGVKNFDEDVPLIIGYYLKRPATPPARRGPAPGHGSLEIQPAQPTAEQSPDTL